MDYGARPIFYSTPTSTLSRTSLRKQRTPTGEPGAGDLLSARSTSKDSGSPSQYTRKSLNDAAPTIFETDQLYTENKDLKERLERAQLDIESYKSALKVSADNKKDVIRRLDALEESFSANPDGNTRLLNSLCEIKAIVAQEKNDCDLYDVLRQNADTIIVIDREMKSVVDGYGDAYKRAKAVHSQLSKISAAICEKLDEVNLESYNSADSRTISISSVASSPMAPTQDSDESLRTGVEIVAESCRPSSSIYSQASVRMDAVIERLNHLQRAFDAREDTDQKTKLNTISVALVNVASGATTPELAYAELVRIEAPVTLADLQAVAPHKKQRVPKVSNSFKALRRIFSMKKSSKDEAQ